jgi:hypothetical protein
MPFHGFLLVVVWLKNKKKSQNTPLPLSLTSKPAQLGLFTLSLSLSLSLNLQTYQATRPKFPCRPSISLDPRATYRPTPSLPPFSFPFLLMTRIAPRRPISLPSPRGTTGPPYPFPLFRSPTGGPHLSGVSPTSRRCLLLT